MFLLNINAYNNDGDFMQWKRFLQGISLLWKILKQKKGIHVHLCAIHFNVNAYVLCFDSGGEIKSKNWA